MLDGSPGELPDGSHGVHRRRRNADSEEAAIVFRWSWLRSVLDEIKVRSLEYASFQPTDHDRIVAEYSGPTWTTRRWPSPVSGCSPPATLIASGPVNGLPSLPLTPRTSWISRLLWGIWRYYEVSR